jgi:hypothetical protein
MSPPEGYMEENIAVLLMFKLLKIIEVTQNPKTDPQETGVI